MLHSRNILTLTMKHLTSFLILLMFILMVPACQNDNITSYPPRFTDMLFLDENGQTLDTITAATYLKDTLHREGAVIDTIVDTLATELTVWMQEESGSQNVTRPFIRWTLDDEVVDSHLSGSYAINSTFKVPVDLPDGPHKMTAEITYILTDGTIERQTDYITPSGLEVKFPLDLESFANGYTLICTKSFYSKKVTRDIVRNNR